MGENGIQGYSLLPGSHRSLGIDFPKEVMCPSNEVAGPFSNHRSQLVRPQNPSRPPPSSFSQQRKHRPYVLRISASSLKMAHKERIRTTEALREDNRKSDRSPSRNMIGRIGLVSASLVATFAAFVYAKSGRTASSNAGSVAIPAQAVLVDPLSFAVIGANGTFRQDATIPFNPTNMTPPFFQVLDPRFLTLLGPNGSIRAVASNPGFAFAHEAPIWVPETDELFFASNDGGALGFSDLEHNSKVGKISLRDVDRAASVSGSATSALNVSVTELDLPDTIQMTNGGTGPFRGNLLLVTSGRGARPPSVSLVNPHPPNNVTVLLDNFFGRQFNSLNDVKVHPTSGKIFFTDSSYGFLNQFRPEPLLRNQVYRFDPDTRAVRVVADGFLRSNGIAFSGDGKTAYVTDTGLVGGFLGNNQTDPATIYQFDVDPATDQFTNRRVFAFTDTGIPDGVQVDAQGHVYAGCGDGVQVWAADGALLGKFFLGTTSANMAFAGPRRLMICAETAVFEARVAVDGLDLASFT